MMPRWEHVSTIASREFVATVRRRAYVLTLVLMPLYLAFVTAMGTLPAVLAKRSTESRVVAIVDPGHVLALAQGEDAALGETWKARPFADLGAAQQAFAHGEVRSILYLAPDYMKSGVTVRYQRSGGVLTGGRLGPPLADFVRARLLASRLDSTLVARARTPLGDSTLVAAPHGGGFEPENNARRIGQFALPMAFAFLLAVGIFTAGGYLMQGLGEEKESRIL